MQAIGIKIGCKPGSGANLGLVQTWVWCKPGKLRYLDQLTRVIGKIPIRSNIERRIKLISAFYLYSTSFSHLSLSFLLEFLCLSPVVGFESSTKKEKRKKKGGGKGCCGIWRVS
jgi:hypothetical protein